MIAVPEAEVLRKSGKRGALLCIVRLDHERSIAWRGAVFVALALDETTHGGGVVLAWLPFLVDLV
jgi:hypothetical protein